MTPYVKNKKDSTVIISGYVERTVFNTHFHDGLYNDIILYLENHKSFDKLNIDYIKQQILNEDLKWKWEQSYVLNATITDTLKKNEGYHISKPIISSDKTIFIIINHWTGTPQGDGRCGFVHQDYIPMIFQKIDNNWIFLRSFKGLPMR